MSAISTPERTGAALDPSLFSPVLAGYGYEGPNESEHDIEQGINLLQELEGRAVVGPDAPFDESKQEAIRTAYDRFVDSKQLIAPNVQIRFMEQVLRRVHNNSDLTIPRLNPRQQRDLDQRLWAHPELRVVPTPFMTLEQLGTASESARSVSHVPLRDESVLRLPQPTENPMSAWLVRHRDDPNASYNGQDDPNNLNREKTGPRFNGDYALRYKTPDGHVVDRATYLQALLDEGLAVQGEDGTVWTFPVTDISTTPELTDRAVNEVYPEIDAVNTIELSYLGMIMQAAAGKHSNGAISLVNGATYHLDEHGHPDEPRGVETGRYRSDKHFFGYWLRDWFSKREYILNRTTLSGIGHRAINAAFSNVE